MDARKDGKAVSSTTSGGGEEIGTSSTSWTVRLPCKAPQEGKGQEEIEGKPYVGKSGKLLDELLQKARIDFNKDVYFCNVIKCRPPNNRKPEPSEIIRYASFKTIYNIKINYFTG